MSTMRPKAKQRLSRPEGLQLRAAAEKDRLAAQLNALNLSQDSTAQGKPPRTAVRYNPADPQRLATQAQPARANSPEIQEADNGSSLEEGLAENPSTSPSNLEVREGVKKDLEATKGKGEGNQFTQALLAKIKAAEEAETKTQPETQQTNKKGKSKLPTTILRKLGIIGKPKNN